jgi:uncharacterized protein
MKTLDWVALIIVIVGAINLGIMGLFGIDLFGAIFGPESAVTITLLAIIGIAALWLIYTSFTRINTCSRRLKGHPTR